MTEQPDDSEQADDDEQLAHAEPVDGADPADRRRTELIAAAQARWDYGTQPPLQRSRTAGPARWTWQPPTRPRWTGSCAPARPG